MLVPATAEDLKKHGQITITPKEENEGNKAEVEQGNTAENGFFFPFQIICPFKIVILIIFRKTHRQYRADKNPCSRHSYSALW